MPCTHSINQSVCYAHGVYSLAKLALYKISRVCYNQTISQIHHGGKPHEKTDFHSRGTRALNRAVRADKGEPGNPEGRHESEPLFRG